jgi:hypothetical protein
MLGDVATVPSLLALLILMGAPTSTGPPHCKRRFLAVVFVRIHAAIYRDLEVGLKLLGTRAI